MSEMIFVKRKEWEDFFNGWHIVDCCIRDKHLIRVIARKTFTPEETSLMMDYEIDTRAIQIQRDSKIENERCADSLLQEWTKPMVGVSHKPVAQDLIVSSNNKGTVYATGSGHKKLEYISPEGQVPATQKIVTIDGYAYSVGLFRKIYKRVDLGEWEKFNDEGIPDSSAKRIKGELQSRSHMGFNDMDGPNENHMYAVGGHGEVFRYDGSRWHRCDFPSNEQLSTVTVAPDGTVYIGGEGGNLWEGKEDTWLQIHRGSSSVLYNDSVWFDNKLWLSSDYQFLILNGDKVERAKFGEQELPFSGHMDARDGLLVIASLHQVYAFDGKEWQCLVSQYA